jgi:hypothetical protein
MMGPRVSKMSTPRFLNLPQRTKSEEELISEGWARRFVGGPPRLQEMVELYRSLGYEVLLEPQALDEFRDECEDCTLALRFFRMVYIRRKKNEFPG